MRFTSGCCAGIRITEKEKYLMFEFCGEHHPHCHEELVIKGHNYASGGSGFRPYLSSKVASDDVESGMNYTGFITFSEIH